MTCTPDRVLRPGRFRLWRAGLLLAAIAGAMVAAPGQAAPAGEAGELVVKARRALQRGDGVDAESKLKAALVQGARRGDVAAWMGQALLAQGKPGLARGWLGPQDFSADTAAAGFRALARLEQAQGNLRAAGAEFDRAIALAPRDAGLWVEVGRLRYAGGEHLLAIDAADYALQLDPQSARALELRGQLVRDRYGLAAALPWFEAALEVDPRDLAVLGEYAATLGDLGRARDMLAATRRMLAIDGTNARAFYLQAVLAARAGDTSLARAMLNRTGNRLRDVPGAMLLDAVLEMRAGNYLLASEGLEKLARRQPANARVRDLAARALFLAGRHRDLVARFAPLAAREDATPYLLTTLGRAYEVLGQRDLAAPLLDRAAMPRGLSMVAVPDGSPIGALVASGQLAAAEAQAESDRAAYPGSATAQIVAGDVQLALRRGPAALERYAIAARVRMPEGLMRKMVLAHVLSGRRGDAAALVDAWLYENPSSREAAWLAARFAGENGNWARAGMLLAYLASTGSGRDVSVLARLAEARWRTGAADEGAAAGARAWRLQRASAEAALAWGQALEEQGKDRARARALLARARAIVPAR